MLDKIKGIEDRYEEINRELNEVGDDYKRATELSKERADLEPIVKKAQEYRKLLESIEQTKEIIKVEEEEMVELAQMELAELEPKVEPLENAIKAMLLPTDKRDHRNVIMEIRAGAGGD
jgi:peptide chain release factor 1